VRVGRQQSNRVAAELLADTWLAQGFQLNFLYAPSSLKCFIVILELLLLSMAVSLVFICFAVGCYRKLGTGTMSYLKSF